MLRNFSVVALALTLATGAAGAQETLDQSVSGCDDPQPLTHVLTDKPLPHYKPDEEITAAVETFHCSGENVYLDDEAATGEGKSLFRLCGSCHNPDGSGRIGPSLIDDDHKYPRVADQHGEFEVIYGGAAGAMQPFGRRFTQDEILKIMAYVETLKGN